jgi:radical SAM protein with 4Fe4S-binding SPASM domain
MLGEIRLVEIEIHSFCNRKCSWCPNRYIDRTKFEAMPEDTYIKVLNDLRSVDYKGTISFSRYNEPMSDIDLLKLRLRQAREILPDVKLVSNTNGDFLSKENLDGLLIDELTIMDYDNKGNEPCSHKLENCGVVVTEIDYPFIRGQYGDMNVLYYVDWPKNAKIEDRGGSLIEYSGKLRNKPCHEPRHFVGIDYNGNVMPCCHMRSDNPKHHRYSLGNIHDSSILQICDSGISDYYRLAMGGYNEELYLGPCKYCQKQPGRYTKNNPGIEY